MHLTEKDVSTAFKGLGTATLYECATTPPDVLPLWTINPGQSCAGKALCVAARRGDNLAIHHAVARPRPGSVIVADCAMDGSRAYWGAMLTSVATRRGFAGVVLSGAVRDVAVLRRSGFPVFARGISPAGPSKAESGVIGGTITIDNVTVTDGQWVVADDDGVIVLHPEDEAELIDRARKRASREFALYRGSGDRDSYAPGLG